MSGSRKNPSVKQRFDAMQKFAMRKPTKATSKEQKPEGPVKEVDGCALLQLRQRTGSKERQDQGNRAPGP